MIEVVAGVIIREGRILLTQRRADKDFPYCWESPGGKVEGLHESHHTALARELREELGVGVREAAPNGELDIGQQPLWCGKFENKVQREDRAVVFVLLYRVTIIGDPRPLEGQGMGWFTASEMQHLAMAPANEAARSVILRRLG
mgnify:CR=1 FL=1